MLRLGVVGYGGRASGVVNCLLNVDPDIRITAIVDTNEKAARERMPERDREEAIRYKSVDAMMRAEKLDGVLIGTRCNTHASLASKVAKYKVPLFLEKPVAVSMSQATSLEKAFAKAKCPVVIGFPLRVSPLCTLARQYIEDGEVGEPVHIMATNYVPYGRVYWENFYRDYNISGGLFLQKATHDLDYMSYLMGSPVVRVGAMATYQKIFGGNKAKGLRCSACKEKRTCPESPAVRKRNNIGTADDHVCLFSKDCGTVKTGTNEDCSSVVVEFANGAHGIYTQVFFVRGETAERGAKVSGYNGTVGFDWYTNKLQFVSNANPSFTNNVTAGAGISHFGGDHELAKDFVDLMNGRGKSRTPISTGLQSVYTCLAARESANTGKFVKVRQCGLK